MSETPTTTTTNASTASLPCFSVCGYDGLHYKPTSLYWCTSLCSDYITNLHWTTWTLQSATAIGTLMTRTDYPNCAQGKLTQHHGYLVVLGVPKRVTYCVGKHDVTRLLFTQSNLWGQQYSLPSVSTCP